MNIYLVSNNLVLNDLSYETEAPVDDKRVNRPLSIEGEKMALYLAKKMDASEIYSSAFASALGTAKYLAQKLNLVINIDACLNDLKIGAMGRHNIKMLRFMQDKNFDYKFAGGESLNEANRRITIVFNKLLKKENDIVIFTHKRAMMALLLNYCEKGYNLDDRLILSYQDEVVLDDSENDVDLIKITLDNGKITNIKTIDVEMEEENNAS